MTIQSKRFLGMQNDESMVFPGVVLSLYATAVLLVHVHCSSFIAAWGCEQQGRPGSRRISQVRTLFTQYSFSFSSSPIPFTNLLLMFIIFFFKRSYFLSYFDLSMHVAMPNSNNINPDSHVVCGETRWRGIQVHAFKQWIGIYIFFSF